MDINKSLLKHFSTFVPSILITMSMKSAKVRGRNREIDKRGSSQIKDLVSLGLLQNKNINYISNIV